MSDAVKHHDDFVPRCLSCRYELTGIADHDGRGVCPECAAHFDLAELREVALRRSSCFSILPPDWLAAAAVAASILCPPIPQPRGCRSSLAADFNYLVLPLIWTFTASWIVARRNRLFSFSHSWKLIILAAPLLRTTLGIQCFDPESTRVTLLGIVALFFVLAGVAYYKSRSVAPPLLIAGMFAAVPGLVLLLRQSNSISRHWSDWPDPRFGQTHEQYPFTQSEVLWIGATLAIAGTIVIIAGAILEVRRATAQPAADLPPNYQPR